MKSLDNSMFTLNK